MSGMQQNPLSRSNLLPTTLTTNECEIAVAFGIKADSRRVLYALSFPEYIEAWLNAPDPDSLVVGLDAENDECFRVDVYRGESVRSTIYGSICIPSTRHVRYIWNQASASSVSKTIVDLVVVDYFGGCSLGMKHSGFGTSSEGLWHRNMWDCSFERLGRLITASTSHGSQQPRTASNILAVHSPKPIRGRPGVWV
jgi:hypothetical protein